MLLTLPENILKIGSIWNTINKNVKTNIVGHEYKILTPSDYYQKDGDSFIDISNDEAKRNELIKNAITGKIVGIARQKTNDDNQIVDSPLGFSKSMTDLLIKHVGIF